MESWHSKDRNRTIDMVGKHLMKGAEEEWVNGDGEGKSEREVKRKCFIPPI